MFTDFSFELANNCGQDLEVIRQSLFWTDATGNGAQLTDVCYDDPVGTLPENCTSIFNFSPAQPSPASAVFGTPLPFDAARDDFDPLQVGYKFDTTLVDQGKSIGETVTINLFFRVQGASVESSCQILLATSPLTVVPGS